MRLRAARSSLNADGVFCFLFKSLFEIAKDKPYFVDIINILKKQKIRLDIRKLTCIIRQMSANAAHIAMADAAPMRPPLSLSFRDRRANRDMNMASMRYATIAATDIAGKPIKFLVKPYAHST